MKTPAVCHKSLPPPPLIPQIGPFNQLNIAAHWFDWAAGPVYPHISSTALLELHPVSLRYLGRTAGVEQYLNIKLTRIGLTKFWALQYEYHNIPFGPSFFRFEPFYMSNVRPVPPIYLDETVGPNPGNRRAYITL